MDSLSISSENRDEFLALCNKLKLETSTSVWTPLFVSDEDFHEEASNDDVTECPLEELEDVSMRPSHDNVNLGDALKKECGFTLEIYEKDVLELKLALENIVEAQPQEIPHLEIFSKIPPSSLCSLCEKLDTKNLKDATISTLLNALLGVNPPISVSMVAALLRCLVLPKIMEENASSFRSLSQTIVNFSDRYGLAVVEELFLPCMMSGKLGSSQIEILTKIISQINHEELICCCIRKLLEVTEPTDNLYAILKTLTDKKANADNLYSLFVLKLKEWSESYSSNMSFTKLVISFITSYGSKVSNEQYSTLQEIISSNKTLLKKAAESSLNKAKK